MHLSDLTWQEVSDYLEARDALILPVGICEQHSRHLPLSTDTVVAEYIAEFLSEKTGFLVAPTFNYGVGLPCDKVFPGSTTIGWQDMRACLTAIFDWWNSQGFKKIFVITAHGDPFHLKALRETGHEGVFVLDLYDIDLTDILEKQKTVKHACEAETSVMLYLFPESVRLEKIEDFETPDDLMKQYLSHSREDAVPGSPGCQGYPSSATKQKGKRIVELMKRHALAWITRHTTDLGDT